MNKISKKDFRNIMQAFGRNARKIVFKAFCKAYKIKVY